MTVYELIEALMDFSPDTMMAIYDDDLECYSELKNIKLERVLPYQFADKFVNDPDDPNVVRCVAVW